jgi:hypothetical protein
MKPASKPAMVVSCPKKQSLSQLLDDGIPPPPPPPVVNRKDLPDLPPLHPCSPSCIVKEIILTRTTNPQLPGPQSKDDKQFKPKEDKEKCNKADKKDHDRRTVNKDKNKVKKCISEYVLFSHSDSHVCLWCYNINFEIQYNQHLGCNA